MQKGLEQCLVNQKYIQFKAINIIASAAVVNRRFYVVVSPAELKGIEDEDHDSV